MPKITDRKILTAFANPCAGPGWSNSPIIVVTYGWGMTDVKTEFIQPDKQSDAMHVLFPIAAEVNRALVVESSMILKMDYYS